MVEGLKAFGLWREWQIEHPPSVLKLGYSMSLAWLTNGEGIGGSGDNHGR